MPKVLMQDQVVYVEPNMIDEKSDFLRMMDNYKKSPDLEDFCIVVDLDVEVKGRTLSSSKNISGDMLRMEYTSSTGGERISFMQGSKIYLDSKREKYITSLTTDYTNTYLTDVVNGGTCEMFGIKSINIDYDNWMVPQVNIQFVDVRGVSLFAQEEHRHNVVEKGMTGVVNQDIEGSFFKCFFTFPYPKFTLRVKGFYGQMVSYELSCSDFRSTFDSSTGNFNVNAKFIGFKFSFLSDIMANACLAAPYSPYLGKDYWASNNGTRFTVLDANGSPQPMKTFAEICKVFNMVKQKVSQDLTQTPIEDLPLSDEQKQAIKESIKDNNIEAAKKDYNKVKGSLIAVCKSIKTGTGNGDGAYKITNTKNSWILANDNSNKNYQAKLETFLTAVDSFNQSLEDNAKKSTLLQQALNSKGKVVAAGIKKEIKADDNFWESESDIKEEKTLAYLKANCVDSKPIFKAWQIKENTRLVIYQDMGWQEFFDASNTVIPTDTSATNTASGTPSSENVTDAASTEGLTQAQQEVADQLMAQEFANAFNFPPTVENITKIFMAHMETFIKMVCDCSNSIMEKGSARSLEALGVTLDDFVDAMEDSSTEKQPVAPFPKVTKEVEEDGVTQREDAWIGEFGNEETFEEIKLVEGILKGTEVAAKIINYPIPAAGASGDTATEVGKCPMKYPLSLVDLFMNTGDNPFGSIDLSNRNDVWGHFIVRAATLFCFSDMSDSYASEVGRLDAENFYEYFKNDSNINRLKAFLINISGDKIENEVTLAKNGPWMTTKLIQISNGNIELYPGMLHKTASFVPTKNWDWKSWDKAADKDLNYFVQVDAKSRYKYIATGNLHTSSHTVYRYPASFSITSDKVKALGYVKNSIAAIPDGELKSYLSNISTFDVKTAYRFGNVLDMFTTADNKSVTVASLQYDENGVLTNAASIKPKLFHAFSDYNVYTGTTIQSKAKHFLDNFDKSDNTYSQLVSSVIKWIGTKTNEREKIIFVPRIVALVCGAQYYGSKKAADNSVQLTIYTYFSDYFENWAKTHFQTIYNNYALVSKDGSSITPILGKITNAKTDKAFASATALLNDNFKQTYTVQGPTAYPTTSDALTSLSSYFLEIVAISQKTRFYNGGGNGNVVLSNTPVVNYLQAVCTKLSELCGTSEGQETDTGNGVTNANDSATATISLGGNTDDLKVGVYNYCKLLYDKWLAADTGNMFYNMETLFGGTNPCFHFIDSYYNNIGKKMFINMSKLVDQIRGSQTAQGLPLMSMMSEMYATNQFQLLFIQNFVDMANADRMREMFTPVPYIQIKEPDNHQEFIVMYAYEPSSKLDIKGSEYPDDSFLLNEATTWPKMITNKTIGSDLPVPAFGVTYGQQYQSYFTNIEVSMESPIATEQSITAQFMIAGANVENEDSGPRHITVGQDLYTIYSNNSYTCTVTMMGCMWVQPMMYFVLNNIPMFRGSYQIYKVNHTIEAGNIVTKFTGVRMAKTATRAVKQYLYGTSCDSTAGDLESQIESFNNANANVGNNCKYAYYSPLGGSGEGQDFSADLNKEVYAVVDHDKKRSVRNYLDSNPYWRHITVKEALSLFLMQEWYGTSANDTNIQYAVAACMYNMRGVKEGWTWVFISQFAYFTGKSPNKLAKLKNRRDNKSKQHYEHFEQIIVDTFTNGPYHALVGKTNKLGGTVTLEQVQKVFGYWGYSDEEYAKKSAENAKIFADLKAEGDSLFRFENSGQNYHVFTSSKSHKDGFKPKQISTQAKISEAQKKANMLISVKSGLTQSVQASLNASQYYSSSKVTATYGKGNWMKLSASGQNANNAMFDCIAEMYGDWFDTLYWNKGNGNINADAIGVYVRVTTTPPKKHYLCLTDNSFKMSKASDYPKVVRLSSKNEINPTLKLALIKYAQKNDIKTAAAAKDAIHILSNLSNSDVSSLLELNGKGSSSASTIQECSSLAGYPAANGGFGSVNITNGTIASANDRGSQAKTRKINELFGGSLPTSNSQMQKYLKSVKFTALKSTGGEHSLSVTIHKGLENSLIGAMNAIKSAGYCVDTIGGQSWRNTQGKSTCRMSNHSYGVAIDINAGSAGNPYFVKNIQQNDTPESVAAGGVNSCPYHKAYNPKICFWTWNHPVIAIMAKFGWGWGGRYGDTMHFSYFGGT